MNSNRIRAGLKDGSKCKLAEKRLLKELTIKNFIMGSKIKGAEGKVLLKKC